MNDTALVVARRFGPMALVAVLIIAAIASGAMQHLSLADLNAHKDELTREVAAHPVLSLGLFFGLYVLIVLSGIPVYYLWQKRGSPGTNSGRKC